MIWKIATVSLAVGLCQAASYKAPRGADGKPNLNGIWQTLNTANWDIQGHAAQAGVVVALGAAGAEPGGLGVVDGEEIPYLPEAAKKKKENPRKPFKLEAKQTVADLELTPDGKSVLARLRTDGANACRTDRLLCSPPRDESGAERDGAQQRKHDRGICGRVGAIFAGTSAGKLRRGSRASVGLRRRGG